MLADHECHTTLVTKYFFSGALGAVTNIITLYILEGIIGWFYLYAIVPAYVSGFLVAFLFHKYWTYKDYNHGRFPRQLTFYTMVATFNLFLNVPLMYFAVDILGGGVIISQIIIVILLGIIGYIVNTRHTFKERHDD